MPSKQPTGYSRHLQLRLVAETTGAWDKQGARILRLIATAAAAREGIDPSKLAATMLQELSVTIRSFRARAGLRRRAELQTTGGLSCALRAAAVALEATT